MLHWKFPFSNHAFTIILHRTFLPGMDSKNKLFGKLNVGKASYFWTRVFDKQDFDVKNEGPSWTLLIPESRRRALARHAEFFDKFVASLRLISFFSIFTNQNSPPPYAIVFSLSWPCHWGVLPSLHPPPPQDIYPFLEISPLAITEDYLLNISPPCGGICPRAPGWAFCWRAPEPSPSICYRKLQEGTKKN